MLKLMKYELRKQVFSKLVILAIVAILELVMGYGLIVDKTNTIVWALTAIFMVFFISMFYLYFESIITFSNDLKTKNSYMLFMTPNSSYKIVGAKIVTSVVQIFLYGLCYLGIILIDIGIMSVRYHSVSETINFIKIGLKKVFDIDINLTYVFISVLSVLFAGIFVIVVAYLSITLTSTFFSNRKLKGLLSFVVFVAVMFVEERISDAIFADFTFTDQKYLLLRMLWYALLTAVTYLTTSWMLEKRVSL